MKINKRIKKKSKKQSRSSAKKKKVSGSAVGYEVVDKYTQKAHSQGYVARSVYKLEEIDKDYKLIKKNMRILDLGCAPGSWMQYISKKVGPGGYVVGVDIEDVRVEAANCEFHKMDIFEVAQNEAIFKPHAPYDLVVSDAMPKTIGILESDCLRSYDLAEYAVLLALDKGLLKKGGAVLVKVFEGPGFENILKCYRKHFRGVKRLRPAAIRDNSREIYLLGTTPFEGR